MKSFARIITTITLMAVLCINYSTLYAEEWTGIDITGAHVELPELDLYLNVSDDLVETIADESSLTVKLDGKEMNLDNLPKKADQEASAYVIALDISKSISDSEFETIKQHLIGWAEQLNGDDAVAVITFGEEVNLLSEYDSDKEQLVSVISDIALTDSNTKLFEGVRLAHSYANLDRMNLPNKRSIIVVSDGKDDFPGETTKEELLDVLNTDSVPIYSIGMYKGSLTSNKQASLDVMGQLSRATNGRYFQKGSADLAEILPSINEIDHSMYRVELNADQMVADGTTKLLLVELNTGIDTYSDKYEVSLDYMKEDHQAPTVVDFYSTEDNQLVLVFDEMIENYENLENYQINGIGSNGIAGVSYTNQNDILLTIQFENNLESGKYDIEVSGITDISRNKNEMNAASFFFEIKEPIIQEASSEATETTEVTSAAMVSEEEMDESSASHDGNGLPIIPIVLIVVVLLILLRLLLLRRRKLKDSADGVVGIDYDSVDESIPLVKNGTELLDDNGSEEVYERTVLLEEEDATVLLEDDLDATVLLEEEATVLLETTEKVVLSIGKDGTEVVLDMSNPKSIGRSRNCDVQIPDDAEVSRSHATLKFEDEKLLLNDEGSTNGTVFQNEKITKAIELNEGDVFEVGNTGITVVSIKIM